MLKATDMQAPAKRFKETVLTANLLPKHFSPDNRNLTHVILLAIVFYITQIEQVTYWTPCPSPASHFPPLLPTPLERRAREGVLPPSTLYS